jgi:peptidoglycan/xylan/chitin deacetylase (PgdA/CDA1 family)
MSPGTLRQRFSTIVDGGYTVLSLAEGVRRLRDGTLPERAVALTFDDGAADFALAATPLLVEFGFPATVYVSTYYVDKRLPVFDVMLRYLLWKGRNKLATEVELSGATLPIQLGSAQMAATSARSILAAAARVSLDAEAKEALLVNVADRLGIDYSSIRSRRLLELMTRQELIDLPRSLVSVQLHTHRHQVPVDRDLFLKEIADNRAVLSQTRAEPLNHFCYPSGVTHPAFPAWLREAGIETATTCHASLASAQDDTLLLPRYVDTADFTDLEFRGWLSGTSSLLPRRRTNPAIAADH